MATSSAGNGNLNVALRMQADFGDAVRKLDGIEEALVDVGEAAKGAGEQGKKLDSITQATDRAAKGARDAAKATDTLAQSTGRALTVEERRAIALARSAGSAAEQAAQTDKLTRSTMLQEAAARRAATATTAQGVSAKQTAAALRTLPAQITDIGTSLAGGQSPLMVLIQQGGQIKDQFGGLGPTFRTLTGLVTPAGLAITATAGAVIALGAAFNQIESETSAYNLAVQATGNASGATRSNIEELAAAATEASGISKGAARDIAVSLVQSGRLGIDTIANITKTVQAYGAVTGQTTQQAAGALAQLFEKPSVGAAKLNEQFHFLSLEQLRYIQQLEEQGRVEAAQLELSNRLADRLSGLARDNLGTLQRAWNAAAGAAKSFWDAALDIGRTTRPEQSIDDLRAKVAQLRKDAAGFSTPRRGQAAVADPGFGDRVTGRGQLTPNQRLAAAEAQLAKAEEAQRAEAQAAADKRAKAVAEERRIEVERQIKALTETVRTNREKLAVETKKLDEALKLGVIKQPEYDKLLVDAKLRFKDPVAPKPPADPVENAFLSKQQELSLALASAQNRLQNAKDGVTASEDRAVVALEAWLKVNRSALKIDDTRVAKLRELATQTDAANKAAADAVETEKRKERITAGLADVDTELAALTGNTVDAAVARAEERFRKLRADLAEQSDFSGLIRVDKVIDLERAKAELSDLQSQVDQIFGRNNLDGQRLQLEVQTGLTNEIDAKQRLVELNAKTAADVDALIPRMRELASITGNQALAAGIEQIALRTDELKAKTGTLGQQLKSAFTDQVAGALEGLANGTASLGDAVKGVLRGIASELVKVAAQQLALKAAGGVAGAFGGIASAFGFADGGYTGPGSKYKPAGIVHAGEFVNRQEVVRQPGALPFLSEFNRVGMAALAGWRGFVGYADGGLVMPEISAPALPSYQPVTPAPQQASSQRGLRIVNLVDPSMLNDWATSSAGERTIINTLRRNAGAVKQFLA